MSENSKKIINKHSIGTILTFILVIIAVLTFVSFLEDSYKQETGKVIKSPKFFEN